MNAAFTTSTDRISLESQRQAEPMVIDPEDEQTVKIQMTDPRADVFEVTQTREMKRKGIKLPRGWKIFGVKRQSEISNNGESYQYLRY